MTISRACALCIRFIRFTAFLLEIFSLQSLITSSETKSEAVCAPPYACSALFIRSNSKSFGRVLDLMSRAFLLARRIKIRDNKLFVNIYICTADTVFYSEK